jgi:hypothetical protein
MMDWVITAIVTGYIMNIVALIVFVVSIFVSIFRNPTVKPIIDANLNLIKSKKAGRRKNRILKLFVPFLVAYDIYKVFLYYKSDSVRKTFVLAVLDYMLLD